MNDDLNKLIELAREVRMSDSEREDQRRSFAFGNTRCENDSITRETVDREADRLAADGIRE